jgi:hypothetical protein
MCRSLPGRWSVPFLLLLLTGCASSSLQLLQEPPPYLTDLRSEYFTANPDSPYRDDVTVGTVVPGMARFDVLAAWGHPARRVRDGLGREEWTYFDLDSESGDAIEYNLVFKNGVVDKWSARTHKDTGVALKGHEDDKVEKVYPVTEPPTEPKAGKKVPKS